MCDAPAVLLLVALDLCLESVEESAVRQGDVQDGVVDGIELFGCDVFDGVGWVGCL